MASYVQVTMTVVEISILGIIAVASFYIIYSHCIVTDHLNIFHINDTLFFFSKTSSLKSNNSCKKGIVSDASNIL